MSSTLPSMLAATWKRMSDEPDEQSSDRLLMTLGTAALSN